MKKLNELNEKMENDEEVIKLAYAKDMASVNYDDSIRHFGENSNEAKAAQKQLYRQRG